MPAMKIPATEGIEINKMGLLCISIFCGET